MFTSCDEDNRGKGFWMQFANGWTISVQFGSSNYCERQGIRFSDKERVSCKNAEIAVFCPEDKMVNLGGDTVVGFVEPDRVAHIMVALTGLSATDTELPSHILELFKSGD